MEHTHRKILISGGGTGGHVFPAIAIATAIRRRMPTADILFVGAIGRMEMTVVPAAGYPIIGLPVIGLPRKNLLTLFSFFRNLIMSIKKSRAIIRDFSPDVVVGVGGYASFPVLWAAGNMCIPVLIQEQNSYAGISNKLLAKKAKKICVAYENMNKYFPQEKIIYTGNPVREDLRDIKNKRTEALAFYNLQNSKPVLLITGGSLGAATLNKSVIKYLNILTDAGVQVLWQTGKLYSDNIKKQLIGINLSGIYILDFIVRMDLAYAAADIIVARAGACTISELCIVAKPVILVPSPNVAENHQVKNASVLHKRQAAVMIYDHEAEQRLIPEAFNLLNDKKRMESMAAAISLLAKPHAADVIADEIIQLSKKEK